MKAIRHISVHPNTVESATLVSLTGCDSWGAYDIEELRRSCPIEKSDGRRATVEFLDGTTFEFDCDSDGWAPAMGHSADIRSDYAYLDEAIEDLQKEVSE